MIVQFQQEKFEDCIAEINEYLEGHAEEVGELAITPDLELYERADGKNVVIYTMRDCGVLAGYAAFWIQHHPHHADSIFAVNDLIFVHEEYRGDVALRFFKFIERQLEGVDVINYSFKVGHDHPELMEHLGFKHTEKVYTKVMK